MKHWKRLAAMAGSVGLAVPVAQAQYGLVSHLPGTFTDISATGASIASGDDASNPFTSAVTNALLPSPNLFASTNGVISGTSFPAWANTALPAGGVGLGLFALWDDLFVDGPGSLKHQSVIENGIPVEIIEWHQIRTYAGGVTGPRGSFEIKLFASGPVLAQFIYQDPTFAGGGESATIGVQPGAASFSQFSLNTASVAPGTVLSIVPVPSGACCLPNAGVTCAITDAASCAAHIGAYRGNGSVCATANCPAGACCLANGGCVTAAAGSCASQQGVYRGDGSVCGSANCPQPGACCLPSGACSILSEAQCAGTVGAIYRGNGSTCATANCPPPPPPTRGPDIYVETLTDTAYYGAVGSITAYAVGTNACNLGDAPVNWYGPTNQHPVIAMSLYRLMNGRFEQIGQSWLKHGFGSSNGHCPSCIQPPGGGQQLGVGCSDAYGATTNGAQGNLGPRSQVNGTTGVFPYPWSAPGITSAIDRRLQVFTADVTPAQNPGALYFMQGHYVTADDAQWNNGLNNATYRQVTIPSTTATPAFAGPPHQLHPAIRAWADLDLSVTLVAADYTEGGITARFWIAAKATSNGNGTWHYEYAVYNHNANRAAGTFSVAAPGSTAITNLGFHAPFSHSGEPFSNAAWTPSVGSGAVSFATTPYASNPNANAVRWGTLYNFRFDADVAPIIGDATIGLFQPGSPAAVIASGIPVPGPGPCYANCDNSTVSPVLNVNDYICFQNRFAAGDSYANCDGSTAAPVLNVNDFICFQGRFAGGCP